MKNFKKNIFLAIIVIIIITIIIFNNLKKDQYEELQDSEVLITNDINEEEERYIFLHITGEVNNPGVIKIEENSRLVDAVEKAGGLTNLADTNKINLAYILSDGLKIYIPSIYDKQEEDYISEEIGENVLLDNLNTKNKVNINTATQTELETLTGVGPSTALKIINYRKANGKFKNIEGIKNVPGIGEEKYKKLKDEICV